jgi:hypothetical protein
MDPAMRRLYMDVLVSKLGMTCDCIKGECASFLTYFEDPWDVIDEYRVCKYIRWYAIEPTLGVCKRM